MDELTETLATSFAVSTDPNSTAAPHPRFSQYKMKSSDSDQNSRRKNILDEQKSRRFNFANHIRKLTAGSWNSGEAKEQKMELSSESYSAYRRSNREYQDQLMLSEWLVEVPADFEQEWLMVVCPFGKRCLVVSSQGSTNVYSKTGYRVNTFPSHLPGGNRKLHGKYRDNCILDCVYNEMDKTYYVLDIMSWKDHPVYDSETEFRFFWLQSKFAEVPEVGIASKLNPNKFVILPNFPCTKEAISEALASANMEVDGTLFYHKRTHYTFGSTPLVVWLKPYMIPEILGVFVPFKMTEQKPEGYTNYAAHLEHVKKIEEDKAVQNRAKGSGQRRGNRGHKKKEGKMEIGEGDVGTNVSADGMEATVEGEVVDDSASSEDAKKEELGQGIEFNMELMLSEWLLEVPENFKEDWITVVCPVGRRCMLVASKGKTVVYAKGYRIPGYFVSILPGGNRKEGKDFTILDVIYNETERTYYILDVMYWDGQAVYNMETVARFAFLHQKIIGIPDLGKVWPLNHYIFSALKNYPCTKEGIETSLRNAKYEVDGVLFYHKTAKYEPGSTPLVLWVKTYILPEIMDVQIAESFMAEKPQGYIDFAHHVENIEKGIEPDKKKKKKKKKKSVFIPSVELVLPEVPVKEMGKKKKGQGNQNKGYNGQRVIVTDYSCVANPWASPQYGIMGQRRGIGRGLLHMPNPAGAAYSPRPQTVPGRQWGRQISGKGAGGGNRQGGGKSQNAFGMSDIEAALALIEYQSETHASRQHYY
ncbi:hypothetical protein ACJMK2_044704 [Sinanodonta woodiana]|uniref:Snurportin-1 n=1 Tax=Sinanodonta woodiana TaxID=1069815 RepID=A0ABD3W3Q1_SINWO